MGPLFAFDELELSILCRHIDIRSEGCVVLDSDKELDDMYGVSNLQEINRGSIDASVVNSVSDPGRF